MFNPLKFITRFVKSSNQRELDKINPILNKINILENEISKLTQNQCIDKTHDLVKKVNDGVELSEIVPVAFALVREASKRVNQERHFDVQLLGGMVLNDNKIAEMKTGEGKTLTIALAAYKCAL